MGPIRALSGDRRAAIAAVIAAACLAFGRAAAAADPPVDIVGQWTVDPADCANARYVWQFLPDSAALLIDGAPAVRYAAARYQPDGERLEIAFVNERQQTVDFVVRFLTATQLIFERSTVDGHAPGPPDLTRTRWIKCPAR